MTDSESTAKSDAPLWIGGGLVLLVLFVFGQVLRHGFLYYDDGYYLTANEHVAQGLTWAGVKWSLTAVVANMWHPLTLLSHMLDVTLFGLEGRGPGLHHLENALLHAANSVLLFHVLRRMTGATWRAAIVAAIWAVHPLRVESIAWASERKDVLSTMFWLLTTLAYVRWVEMPRAGRYTAVVALYALGLTAKPMLVTLPFALLLLDFWPLGRLRIGDGETARAPLRQLLWEKAPLFALSAAGIGVTLWSQGSTGAIGSAEQFPLWTRLANAGLAYGMYLWTSFVPVNLALMYPHPGEDIPLAGAALGAGAMLGISLVALFGWRRYPYLLTGWFWFAGTLVPVIGLVQVGHSSRADRYTYIPQIGLLIAVVWLVAALCERKPAVRRATAGMAAVVLVALAGLCLRQVSIWRDPITLFSHTTKVSPTSSAAWFNLGVAYAAVGQPEMAEPAFARAGELNPLGLGVMQNWAASLIELGRSEEAIRVLKGLIDLDQNKPEHYYQLGAAYFRMEKYRDAKFYAEEALRINPDFALATELIEKSEKAMSADGAER